MQKLPAGLVLIAWPDFLEPAALAAFQAAAQRLEPVERSYIPAHKQGGTVAYANLARQAPTIAAFYHSPGLQQKISTAVGCSLQPTPLRDQSSLSLLIYDRPGDWIGWHLDHNFYRGRHFTLLIPLINRGSLASGLSHGELRVQPSGQAERRIDTAPNQAVLFEGTQLLHQVSPLHAGEQRVVLSMTFCTDSHATWLQGIARRIKDTAFFGIRALWT